MNRIRIIALSAVVTASIAVAVAAPLATAGQPDSPAAKTAAASQQAAAEAPPESFFDIVFSGGLTGFLIVILLLVLSIIAVALVIEHVMSLRTPVLMPPGLAEGVQAELLAGRAAGADARCRQQPSFLAFVLQAGIAEADGGWSAVEKAMEDAAAEQSGRLFRKIEYLSVIGNIAPMIGLLGTVMGMIFAFQQVSSSQGEARAPELAEGIYTALVTTVGGLLVAIPSLAAFAVFRNRVDQLVAEASYMALQVFAPLKRRRGKQRTANAATAGTTTAANPAAGTAAGGAAVPQPPPPPGGGPA